MLKASFNNVKSEMHRHTSYLDIVLYWSPKQIAVQNDHEVP